MTAYSTMLGKLGPGQNKEEEVGEAFSTPQLRPSPKPDVPKSDMKKALTHSLGLSSSNSNTPMD